MYNDRMRTDCLSVRPSVLIVLVYLEIGDVAEVHILADLPDAEE